TELLAGEPAPKLLPWSRHVAPSIIADSSTAAAYDRVLTRSAATRLTATTIKPSDRAALRLRNRLARRISLNPRIRGPTPPRPRRHNGTFRCSRSSGWAWSRRPAAGAEVA